MLIALEFDPSEALEYIVLIRHPLRRHCKIKSPYACLFGYSTFQKAFLSIRLFNELHHSESEHIYLSCFLDVDLIVCILNYFIWFPKLLNGTDSATLVIFTESTSIFDITNAILLLTFSTSILRFYQIITAPLPYSVHWCRGNPCFAIKLWNCTNTNRKAVAGRERNVDRLGNFKELFRSDFTVRCVMTLFCASHTLTSRPSAIFGRSISFLAKCLAYGATIPSFRTL